MAPGITTVSQESEQKPQGQRGRYEILRVVNRGGMGEIALGRVKGTKGFEKLVVLKRLRADAEREDHLQMFDVEQEVMSKIEHPNIVKVFDQPILDSIPYLAMEYVRGRNLDQVIRQAQIKNEELPLSFCIAVITEVLRGLAFVHRLKDDDGKALGVVHQDMTPSNVMVSFFGEVKITDFGISYVTSRDGGLRKGVLKGKPRYVAPEVLAGKRVNNRADIYGVAVVFYELLTGRALFARNTVKETLAAVARNELPDFARELKQHGEGLARVLMSALHKDPLDRYRTAEAMAADLVSEAQKVGGLMPPARIGYMMRHLFQDDPDVPEMDPALEEIMSREAVEAVAPGLKPQDLEQTLEELDRLLGPSQSVDLFTLPPDLKSELADIDDGDPFLAMTPLPDFVWGAKNEAEILHRAHQEFGGAPSLLLPPEGIPLHPMGTSRMSEEPSDTALELAQLRDAARPREGGYSVFHKKGDSDEVAPPTGLGVPIARVPSRSQGASLPLGPAANGSTDPIGSVGSTTGPMGAVAPAERASNSGVTAPEPERGSDDAKSGSKSPSALSAEASSERAAYPPDSLLSWVQGSSPSVRPGSSSSSTNLSPAANPKTMFVSGVIVGLGVGAALGLLLGRWLFTL